MPKKVKDLSALEVRRINKPGRHAVGNVPGLLLVVHPSGSKNWIYRTKVGARRRNIGLGGYPAVSLKDAIQKAKNNQEMIGQGIDPVKRRKEIETDLLLASLSDLSFSDAADRCHKIKSLEFKSSKHASDWISSIKRHAIPVIGELPIADIDTNHIMEVLNPIWLEKTETATRLRQRLEYILSWAIAGKYREGPNPAKWKDNLEHLLARPKDIQKKKHFRAMPYKEIADFIVELKKRPAITARALEFIIYTAARSGEVRLATWEEIDLKKKLWTIPAERMKAKSAHRVPLTAPAISLLNASPWREGLIFRAQRGGALSDMSISMLCRRMKIDAVPHGFRSTFKDWATETTSYPDIVSEMALAHTVGNAVRAAYQRGDLIDKRRRLLNDWAKYLNSPARVDAGDNVTAIRA